MGSQSQKLKGLKAEEPLIELCRGSEYQIDFLPKSKVEVAIEDSMLEKVIEVVKAATSTGEIGDGKIFVSELQ